jgi:hypothetical protein
MLETFSADKTIAGIREEEEKEITGNGQFV